MRRSFAGILARAAAGGVLAATLVGASAAHAEMPGEGLVRAAAGAAADGVVAAVRVVDEIRVGEVPGLASPPDPGPYAPPPRGWREPVVIEEAVPAFEVERILQARGFEPLGQPVRRRWVYTVSAISPDGDDGRVVVDAHTGRILRFMPAEIAEDEVVGTYGSPGLPSPVQRASVRNLRPPLPIPHAGPRVASRTPAANPAPRPEPKAAAAVPPAAAQAAAQARAEVRPADAKPAEAKPAPPTLQLQPTQEMPPVQGFE